MIGSGQEPLARPSEIEWPSGRGEIFENQSWSMVIFKWLLTLSCDHLEELVWVFMIVRGDAGFLILIPNCVDNSVSLVNENFKHNQDQPEEMELDAVAPTVRMRCFYI
ncbi:hypothetical protein RRG08_032003 [Elysia crispata]|uniref:Uncharacterized protein n=1 Tax=Elysia crispata TaxID=231223 RepID=A0AAE1A413_9GAST|nr:hypothetical protein RRG08_032003 [Elysia crispata]